MKRIAQRLLTVVGPPVAAAVVGLAAWEIAARALHLPLYLVPPPSRIAVAARAASHELWLGCVATGTTALGGLALSTIVGVLIAVILSTSRLLERAFQPYAVLLQTVPIVAIAPLLVLWFGVGSRAVTASSFIVSVFPVIANTLGGLRSVDPALDDLFTIQRASRWQRLTKLALPWAMPQIAVGLRVASGLAVIGAIVGELVAGVSGDDPGLGLIVMSAYRQLRTDLLFAAVLGSALLGMALVGMTTLLTAVPLRHRGARQGGRGK